jgi:hypothetical protein
MIVFEAGIFSCLGSFHTDAGQIRRMNLHVPAWSAREPSQ